MNLNDYKQHIIDTLKGLIGAMVAGAVIAGIQFVTGHIPALVSWLTMFAGSFGAIKVTK